MKPDLRDEEIIAELRATSMAGRDAFEVAIAKTFSAMGAKAVRHGGTGEADVIVELPYENNIIRVAIEAKGGRRPLRANAAGISEAGIHSTNAGAQLAVIVAREFQGARATSPNPSDSTIIAGCRATNGAVTIATVDVLVELLQRVRREQHSLREVYEILRVNETPAEKIDRIKAMKAPSMFPLSSLLDDIWEEQEDAGGVAYYGRVKRLRWPDLDYNKFTQLLHALQNMIGHDLIEIDATEKVIVLKQDPELLKQRLQRVMSATRAGVLSLGHIHLSIRARARSRGPLIAVSTAAMLLIPGITAIDVLPPPTGTHPSQVSSRHVASHQAPRSDSYSGVVHRSKMSAAGATVVERPQYNRAVDRAWDGRFSGTYVSQCVNSDSARSEVGPPTQSHVSCDLRGRSSVCADTVVTRKRQCAVRFSGVTVTFDSVTTTALGRKVAVCDTEPHTYRVYIRPVIQYSEREEFVQVMRGTDAGVEVQGSGLGSAVDLGNISAMGYTAGGTLHATVTLNFTCGIELGHPQLFFGTIRFRPHER
ncbi:MAG TPA: hypothetical protein VNQ77_20095 [Frankiaceae bacterium]|nr:hypothetical protein [Frankiaceae bacterium]